MRGGKEKVCVLEIVRPGMEVSESAKKQENTGIGPASACRGESAFTRVFHAPKARLRASFTRYGTPNGCLAQHPNVSRQPAAAGNDRPLGFLFPGLLFTGMAQLQRVE